MVEGRQTIIPSCTLIAANNEEINKNNSTGLKVYPNPFNNTLHINFELEKEETVHLSLIDINGAVLQEHSRKFTKGFQNMSLDADVSPGTYFIKVEAGNQKSMTATVIKL